MKAPDRLANSDGLTSEYPGSVDLTRPNARFDDEHAPRQLSTRRLATTSLKKILKPVRLPPGRARLATRPSLTGSSHHRIACCHDWLKARRPAEEVLKILWRKTQFLACGHIGFLQLDHVPSLELAPYHWSPFTVLSSRMLLQVGH
jgi:hypothetical protein